MEQSELEMLVQSAQRWFARNTPHGERVASFSRGNVAAPGAWNEMAGMGWLGLTLPESQGGSGAGAAEAFDLLRSAGRDARPEPLGLHLMLAPRVASAIPDMGPSLADGSVRLAMADGARAGNRALLEGGRLSGELRAVEGIADATHVLVPVGAAGQPGNPAMLLDLKHAGIVQSRARWVDGRVSAVLTLRDVPAVEAMPADTAIDLAAAAQVADASGVMQEAFVMTLDYLRQRVQFGKPLSSQQAIQHRMAEVFCDMQLQFALASRLAHELDAAPSGPWPTLAVAKSYVGRRVLRAVGALIQVSGGIAVTEEYRLTHLYRRLHVAAQLYGTPETQLERIDARALLSAA